MRVLCAFVLLTLCLGTFASWFLRDPVHRSLSAVHATAAEGILSETALERVRECIGTNPFTMADLAEYLRSLGRPESELLEWRLLSFTDEKGELRKLSYRTEAGSEPPDWKPDGDKVVSDVSSRLFRLPGHVEWRLQEEKGRVVAVEFFAAGIALRCTSAFGSASCDCTRASY